MSQLSDPLRCCVTHEQEGWLAHGAAHISADKSPLLSSRMLGWWLWPVFLPTAVTFCCSTPHSALCENKSGLASKVKEEWEENKKRELKSKTLWSNHVCLFSFLCCYRYQGVYQKDSLLHHLRESVCGSHRFIWVWLTSWCISCPGLLASGAP